MLLETKIPLGYVVRKVWRDAVNVVLIAAVTEVIVHYGRQHIPDVPATLPAFLGTTISLLLSFKLNQSYDRWWATHMQDPFANRPTDISCTAIARTIEINIRELLGDRTALTPLPSDGFYLM